MDTLQAKIALQFDFPGLRDDSFEVTSEKDDCYNCIAWAAGEKWRWWWPDAFNQQFWPRGVPRRPTREAFILAFKTLGYEVCQDSYFEKGWEKVALYEDPHGKPKHAARQLPDGRWTSKMGEGWDIAHSLDQLEGQRYGQATVFLRRRVVGG
jgi:hypothetical protein